MSRIGKLPIEVPKGVTITLADTVVTVKGPKGQLSRQIMPAVSIVIKDSSVAVERPDDSIASRAAHGLTPHPWLITW